jgi:hypothetical protein
MQHEVDVLVQRGVATVRVPLDFTAGRAGFGPRLTLEYSSAEGNSAFGISWSLSGLLSISLSGTRGHPRYDGTDRFAFSCWGPVPRLQLEAGGVATSRRRPCGFWVHYYRPLLDTEKATAMTCAFSCPSP